jgi:hypothetical protein
MRSRELPPDPVIEAYKKDIDRTLLRENLKLTPDQRVRKMLDFAEAVKRIRGAARKRR